MRRDGAFFGTLLRGEDTAYQKSGQREQQAGDKTELMDDSLQVPTSVHEIQKQTATAPEQNGNKPLRRFSPRCQEDATNIAYARGAVRQHELFDAGDQANAVRGCARMIFRERGRIATRRRLTGQRDGDVRLRSAYEPNDQTDNQ